MRNSVIRSRLIMLKNWLLITLVWVNFSPGLAHAERGKKSHQAGVKVEVDARAYRPGVPVKIKVVNTRSHSIALPGCATYSLEQFSEEQEDFVPLRLQRCEWEKEAVLIPKGERVFEFNPPHSKRAILRVVLTYGLGCQEGVPLGSARCSSLHTAYSSTFVLLPGREK